MSRTIYVYDAFSSETSIPLGSLYVDSSRGTEHYSFEYDADWLKNSNRMFTPDPELPLIRGRQYPNTGKLFGMFADASPDRWGRVLMNKHERILADKENRKPSKLLDSDYLLGVYDESRMGGLRFKTDPEGEFMTCDNDYAIPPVARLRTLEEASRSYEEDETLIGKWIEQLLRPGSSLGGTRPKATVIDTDGSLWIAKFPSKNDDFDIGAWEKVAHELALLCGLKVPATRLEKFSKNGSTFLTKRFDREKERRIHYASAMTLLNKQDGASAADGTGYLDIASFIRSESCRPKEDLIELWKRIVFNMAITNTDDHLKNHAFLLTKNGWTLSPLYDVNPVPYGEELAINVDDTDNRINIDLAIDTAVHFGIDKDKARTIAGQMLLTVSQNWERLAKDCGISRGQIEEMRPAFSLAI